MHDTDHEQRDIWDPLWFSAKIFLTIIYVTMSNIVGWNIKHGIGGTFQTDKIAKEVFLAVL